MTMPEPHQVPRQVDAELDATGLTCPMPLLKAKQALNRLEVGQTLRVRATDPGSERDFDVFARQSGHELLHASHDGGAFTYVMRKTS